MISCPLPDPSVRQEQQCLKLPRLDLDVYVHLLAGWTADKDGGGFSLEINAYSFKRLAFGVG